MLNLIWDMETGDPDDLFTLFLLLNHPDVNLKAVTVTPGTPDQIGLVRWALHQFDRDLPVGAHHLDHPKQCVSDWYYDTYGNIPPSREAVPAAALLLALADDQTTLLTGAPLKNLGAAIRAATPERPLVFQQWVAQGGFAGEGVVPAAKQLEQFRGKVTCPTFNLNGDPKAALLALDYPNIPLKHFVSKNVCHGVYYDAEMHSLFATLKGQSLSHRLIWQGMNAYFKYDRAGKKFHDPLAACCALDPSIGIWAEVNLYREKGEWGARLHPGSNTWIITDYNREQFIRVLTRL